MLVHYSLGSNLHFSCGIKCIHLLAQLLSNSVLCASRTPRLRRLAQQKGLADPTDDGYFSDEEESDKSAGLSATQMNASDDTEGMSSTLARVREVLEQQGLPSGGGSMDGSGRNGDSERNSTSSKGNRGGEASTSSSSSGVRGSSRSSGQSNAEAVREAALAAGLSSEMADVVGR